MLTRTRLAPFAIAVLMILTEPAPARSAEHAPQWVAQRVAGRVEIRQGRQTLPRSLQQGEAIPLAAVVRTGPHAAAHLVSGARSLLLAENTQLVVRPGAVGEHVFLLYGAVLAEAPKRSPALALRNRRQAVRVNGRAVLARRQPASERVSVTARPLGARFEQTAKAAARVGYRSPKVASPATHAVDERDSLERYKAREAIYVGQLRAEVNAVLRRAGQLRRTDPNGAVVLLETTLRRLEAGQSAGHTAVRSLRRRVKLGLREATRAKEMHERQRLESDRSRAMDAEQHRREWGRQQKALQVKARLVRARALMDQGRHAEACAEARLAREADRNSIEAMWTLAMANRFTKMSGSASLNESHAQGRRLATREALGSMAPMTFGVIWYPNSKKWAELTRSRRKYAAVDVASRSGKDQEIDVALKKPVTFDFTDATLADVVEFIRDFSGVNLVLDRPALQEEGISPDTPVSMRLSGVSLKSALRLVLGQLNLTYIVQNEVLLVTSQVEAQSIVVTRVYPVADLVVPIQNAGARSSGSASNLGGGFSGSGFGGSGGAGVVGSRDAGARQDLLEELAQLIEYVVGQSL
jgi:hypothetical protein